MALVIPLVTAAAPASAAQFAFCEQVHPGITPPCGPTEFYPPVGRAKAENGTTNVMN
jgi:hypothetical protein